MSLGAAFHEIRQDRDISPSVRPSTSAKTGLLVFALGVLLGLSVSDIGVFRQEPPVETFRTTSIEFSPPSPAQVSAALSAITIADEGLGLASDNAMARLTKSVVRVSSDVAAGSGVIIDEAGGVLTSAHVVKDSPRVSVDVGHGEWLEGVVTCVDEELDLAFLIFTSWKVSHRRAGSRRRPRPGHAPHRGRVSAEPARVGQRDQRDSLAPVYGQRGTADDSNGRRGEPGQ